MALVWYAAWQMECCGEPFAVGDVVDWTLGDVVDVEWLAAAVGGDLAADVTHVEDHHDVDEGTTVRRGTVRGIRCAYCRYAPVAGGDRKMLHPVAGTAVITAKDRVDGGEGMGGTPPVDGQHVSEGHLIFNGYLVELDLDPP